MEVNDLKGSTENADKLRYTINTPGWEIIQKIMKDKNDYNTEKALTVKKIEDVYFHQAYILALKDLVGEIEAIINQGKEAEAIQQ